MQFDESYKNEIEEKVFREAWIAKGQGTKVFGLYCAFTPKELIIASGAITASLCGHSEKPIERAAQHLSCTLCPLIKSSYGHTLADTCPYFHSADYLVADTTCDSKKKMLMSRIKPTYILHLPQRADGELNLYCCVEG